MSAYPEVMATKQLPPPLLGGIGTASVVEEEDEEFEQPEEIPTLDPDEEPETETAPE